MTTAYPLMTTKEVAKFCRLSHRTFENFRQNGKGPRFVTLGRSIRYLREEVIAWLAGQS